MLAVLVLALISALAILNAAAASACPGVPTAAVVEEIAPGNFVRLGIHAEMSAANAGAIANIGFIIGDEAVAVIDSGGSFCDGEALRLAIRARTAKPVVHVINTHVHPDHIFGNAAFAAENAVFVGHAALPADMAARGDYYLRAFAETMGTSALAGTKIIMPTRLVDAETSLDLGGRRLTLRAHGQAHTGGDLTVYDETTRTLWAGDLVFLDHIPVLDGKLKGWLAVMDELAGIPAARVVPGHGPVSAPWPQALEPQRRYFEALAADLRAHMAKGGGMMGAADKAAAGEAARWELNGDYHIRNVNKAFAELEWE
jgi:quinoprotein relay system zinc metallohydrolase 2